MSQKKVTNPTTNQQIVLNENSIHSRRTPRVKRVNLTKKEIEKISLYLKNPTNVGVWILHAESLTKSGIVNDLKIELNKKIGISRDINLKVKNKEIKVTFSKSDIEGFHPITERFTFIFELFTLLVLLEQDEKKFLDLLKTLPENDQKIIELIDLNFIKTKYPEAYAFFKSNLYFEKFITSIYIRKFSRIKSGLFILFWVSSDDRMNQPDESDESIELTNSFKIISIDSEPLEDIKKFFRLLNRINEETLYPIFSPEEEVFAPYFVLLEQAYFLLIENVNIQYKIRKSIEEYQERHYSQCINTIGLIFEEYLIEIYETCFRDTCPKGKMLGQLLDLIEKKASENLHEVPIMKPDPRPILKTINALKKKKPSDASLNEILTIFRDCMIFFNSNTIFTEAKINSLDKKPNLKSIFPRIIRENINELIRNRNAVSHKTQIPIGNYEALRSIYCFMTVIIWWSNEKKGIDWKMPPDKIMEALIKKNSHSVE
jgi:hypothetical protein